jgi:hypothetical protein
MAYTLRDDKELVGKRVYENYSPAKAGVITEIVHPVGSPKPVRGLSGTEGMTQPRIFADVKVKWLNGTTEVVSTSRLNDFDALIEDHKKKLRTHEATLGKLIALSLGS